MLTTNTQPSATAFGLLIMNGSLIALMLPLARLVTEAGLSPIVYAFWQTLGAGMVLALLSWRHLLPLMTAKSLRYCLISGITGAAFPNAMAFFVVGEIGSGLTSTLYAFPPLVTLMLALALRLESPSVWRLTGITLACLGCFWIVWSQGNVMTTDSLVWYLLGLLVPLSLAVGNVYRTAAWPTGIAPIALAAGMMIGAALSLWSIIVFEGNAILPKVNSGSVYKLVSLQILLTALTYLGFFELQKRSSPVFLSQMGCVAALVGLLIGLTYFDEQYSQGVWVGVMLVITGLWLTNRLSRTSTELLKDVD